MSVDMEYARLALQAQRQDESRNSRAMQAMQRMRQDSMARDMRMRNYYTQTDPYLATAQGMQRAAASIPHQGYVPPQVITNQFRVGDVSIPQTRVVGGHTPSNKDVGKRLLMQLATAFGSGVFQGLGQQNIEQKMATMAAPPQVSPNSQAGGVQGGGSSMDMLSKVMTPEKLEQARALEAARASSPGVVVNVNSSDPYEKKHSEAAARKTGESEGTTLQMTREGMNAIGLLERSIGVNFDDPGSMDQFKSRMEETLRSRGYGWKAKNVAVGVREALMGAAPGKEGEDAARVFANAISNKKFGDSSLTEQEQQIHFWYRPDSENTPEVESEKLTTAIRNIKAMNTAQTIMPRIGVPIGRSHVRQGEANSLSTMDFVKWLNTNEKMRFGMQKIRTLNDEQLSDLYNVWRKNVR